MKVLPYTDPFLRIKAKSLEKITREDEVSIEEMLRLMRAESGVGLAATQVGIDGRIFVMNETPERPENDTVWINPVLKLGVQTVLSEEGCLSVRDPSGRLLRGPVWRSKRVEIKGVGLGRIDGKLAFLDPTNQKTKLISGMFKVTRIYTDSKGGFPSIEPFIAQHENDHLKAVLFTDKLAGRLA